MQERRREVGRHPEPLQHDRRDHGRLKKEARRSAPSAAARRSPTNSPKRMNTPVRESGQNAEGGLIHGKRPSSPQIGLGDPPPAVSAQIALIGPTASRRCRRPANWKTPPSIRGMAQRSASLVEIIEERG